MARIFGLALGLALAVLLPPSAGLAEENAASAVQAETGASSLQRFVIVPFGFRDTSGEVRDQRADHERRLDIAMDATHKFLSESGLIEPIVLQCGDEGCPASVAELVERARVEDGRYMLIGMFQKTSTLIGWVKFDVLDLEAEEVRCDRIISYRGDTDEAWFRAARQVVRDVVRHCLPGPEGAEQ